MTDELVKRLRANASWGDDRFSEAADRIEQLTAERERLALAICGGEDAPGYANAQTVETLEYALKQNRQSHWATINSLLAEEAERDEALNHLDSARYSVEVLEQRVAAVMAERDRLREALDGLLTSVEHADFEDGWCCCGDDMLHHQSPMDCGHTPVDMGEYHASLAIKKARAALKGESRE